jgi:predicted ATPase
VPTLGASVPLSSFIGRERELADVKRLLADTRLLTLTGPGGVGKTRLAIEVSRELNSVDTFADGVWFAGLAPLADAALFLKRPRRLSGFGKNQVARSSTLQASIGARRFGDRFRLLAGGARTAMPRHQTIRALVDWIYELLTKQERTLFCRLGIFAGY